MTASPVAPPEEPEGDVIWTPNQGPQDRFLRSGTFEILFGGSAGGSKTEGLIAKATQQIHKPGYRALLLRQTFVELQEVMDRAADLYPHEDGKWNGNEKRWKFPTYDAQGHRTGVSSYIEFGYFDSWKHHRRYRGRQYSFVGWDEVGDCPEERRWLFLVSRVRSTGPGIVPQICGTANPGGAGHGWLKKRFIVPCGKTGERLHRETYQYTWRGQVVSVALTRQFIPSRVFDNPHVIENNPTYVAQLMSLPELMRNQLLEGDWDAGDGLAFPELSEQAHLIPPFRVPDGWPMWGAFDWGYSHPWVFGVFTANEDGRVILVQTISGRRHRDDEIIDRILAELPVPPGRLGLVAAGHDCWAEIKARTEAGPTTAERMIQAGLPMKQANLSRSDGFRTVLDFVSYRGRGRDRQGDPIDLDVPFVLMKTEENVATLECLARMVTDPDHKGDVLKVDADPVTGDGGDDAYDMVRYGLMERADAAPTTYALERLRSFDRAILDAEARRQRKVRWIERPQDALAALDPFTFYMGG